MYQSCEDAENVVNAIGAIEKSTNCDSSLRGTPATISLWRCRVCVCVCD